MEVHPHSKTERKRWTHYLWEFLMLFLAVFCGFLAENFREHQVEKKREKDFMKEIVESLKYDTVRCQRNLKENLANVRGLDSFRAELKNTIHGKVNSNLLYYFSMKYTRDFGMAIFNTSAITELKASGSIRLIADKSLVLELTDYYERKTGAVTKYVPTSLSSEGFQQVKREIFGMQDFDSYLSSMDTPSITNYEPDYDYGGILLHKPPLQLLSADAGLLEKFYTGLFEFEAELKRYDFWLTYCRDEALKLMADIRKAYHLVNIE